MPDATMEQTWSMLRAEAEALNLQLTAQYEASLGSLRATLSGMKERVEQTQPGSGCGLDVLSGVMERCGEPLFFEAVRSFNKVRPQEKVLDALENHRMRLEDLARRVPEFVALSGAELMEALGRGRKGVRGYLVQRRSRIEMPLRQVVERHFREETNRRAALDGGCLLWLAQGAQMVVMPWQELRRLELERFGRRGTYVKEWTESKKHWLSAWGVLERTMDGHLAALRAWESGAVDRLADAILRGPVSGDGDVEEALQARRQRNFQFWSRQQRAVRAGIDLEWELAILLSDACQEAERALESVDKEQEDLQRELDGAVGWLERAQAGEAEGEFPPPVARLVSAEDRVGLWERTIQSRARQRLPTEVEAVEPERALPGWRQPWRSLEPRKEFLSVLHRVGRLVATDGFREAEDLHRGVIRGIEQAREVVRFSMESAQGDTAEGAQIASEGFGNALSLVNYQKETIASPHERVEKGLVEGIATTFLLLHLSLEKHRLGLLRQLVRQSGARAGRELWNGSVEYAGSLGRWGKGVARARYHWALQQVGWEAAPVAVSAPAMARGYLGDVLSLQMGARNLPAIYRRLFKLAPVEDPRFLVGRDVEMAELARARDLWAANRGVAVVLAGERGSGKTSILNCLVAQELEGLEVVRGHFTSRITGAGEMRAFLGELLGLAPEEDLEEALLAKKRIILIEELERTFLRRMNGFTGLEELLSILSGTCRTTLWILTLNQTSYRYLDAAVGLGEYFSHRINAMSIAPDQLKNAILLRHNLSGLRLHFPSVVETNKVFSKAQRLFGLEPSADERFFDSLYRQSSGIFRSAFELWQHYMERVEGGVLYMRQPAEPDYEPLIAQLRQADLFTLQAIVQHGSLTAGEHSEIFECRVEESRVRLEKLTNLECLEPDPAGPGLRVRPEAGRLVHMALTRNNLL